MTPTPDPSVVLEREEITIYLNGWDLILVEPGKLRAHLVRELEAPKHDRVDGLFESFFGADAWRPASASLLARLKSSGAGTLSAQESCVFLRKIFGFDQWLGLSFPIEESSNLPEFMRQWAPAVYPRHAQALEQLTQAGYLGLKGEGCFSFGHVPHADIEKLDPQGPRSSAALKALGNGWGGDVLDSLLFQIQEAQERTSAKLTSEGLRYDLLVIPKFITLA